MPSAPSSMCEASPSPPRSPRPGREACMGHPRGTVLASLCGFGSQTAARTLAEISRFRRARRRRPLHPPTPGPPRQIAGGAQSPRRPSETGPPAIGGPLRLCPSRARGTRPAGMPPRWGTGNRRCRVGVCGCSARAAVQTRPALRPEPAAAGPAGAEMFALVRRGRCDSALSAAVSKSLPLRGPSRCPTPSPPQQGEPRRGTSGGSANPSGRVGRQRPAHGHAQRAISPIPSSPCPTRGASPAPPRAPSAATSPSPPPASATAANSRGVHGPPAVNNPPQAVRVHLANRSPSPR